MAKNVTVQGASYTAVPAVNLPQTGGGTARFTDTSGVTATASDVASGKVFVDSNGDLQTGTASGGGGSTLVVRVLYPDEDTVQLDKTWQEICDAMLQGIVPVMLDTYEEDGVMLYLEVDTVSQVVFDAFVDPPEYRVVDTANKTYSASQADGYPILRT